MEVETNASSEAKDIDEGLYSRQLYVLGHEAMKRMGSSNVLIVGLRGLGLEIAKDVILTGVKSVTLCDDGAATLFDLSSQYYLSEKDLGKPRAAAVVDKLAELNNYVAVSVHTGEVTADVLQKFQVVVLVSQPLKEQIRVNKICRSSGIFFISADTRGVFGNIFCDFGSEFEVNDTNGEPTHNLVVTGITQENPGIVTVHDDHRIPFEDGDYVTFTEIQGMEELNGSAPRQIKVLSPFTFSIEDTTKYSPYKGGGRAVQVKQPETIRFLPLEEALEKPEFLLTDFAKMESPAQLHLAFQALWEFHERNKSFPEPRNAEHVKEIIEYSKQINEKSKQVEEVDEKLIRLFSNNAIGDVSPMIAFIGGIAAQEVLKAVSGKFMPIRQWFYFDAIEVLPKDEETLPAEEFQPAGTRYDGQIVSLGKGLQERIKQLNVFMVGAGAIGCELLKLFATMGLGAGSKGKIHVTDMDIIEKSNLNRQFLFRPKDVQQLKSQTAANAAKEMNPELNIAAYSNRVGPETENIFGDNFYRSLDLVCNALDNVEARMYMDSQCIFYKKPLLESGTLGTKGNTQVVVPDVTESYGSSRDPPEKSIPICTLHHFPNAIEHTIQWGRDIFEGLYHNVPESVNSYITNPKFMETLKKQSGGSRLETLTTIRDALVSERPNHFEDCIKWGRLKFEEYFNNNIQQLLYNFPLDMITSTGAPFWSGPKRAPTPLTFDVKDPLHIDFVVSSANLRAYLYGLQGTRDTTVAENIISKMSIPKFAPKKDVKIAATDAELEAKKDQAVDDEEERLEQVIAELPSPSKADNPQMQVVEFEKDDDTNFHIDFISAAANLRASNYAIPHADKHKCKGIAGKIIPAMVTTTAVVSGLVCLELLKVIQNKPLDMLKNGFVNLALPFTAFSEPIEPPKTKVRDGWEWTLWDRIEVDGDMTLQEFLDHFKEKYQLDVSMISCGVSMIYAFFMSKDKQAERLPKKLSEVITTISKQPLPKDKNHLILEIVVSRLEDDEEVDVPFVKYNFRR